MARVAIIIPHFNRAKLLQETLKSLQDQEFSDWEAIVVDDGSSKDEWEKACQFDDSRVSFRQRLDGAKGPSRCRNIGLHAATAPFVMFVDSDDLLAPWCVGQRIEFMNQNPEDAFAVFQVMLFSKAPGDTDVLWNNLDGEHDLERFLRADPPWHTSSPLWKRTSLIELGGFNERVMYGDDTDLHMRALLGELKYEKAAGRLPDAFVRRSGEDRITNSASDQLLDSRMIRLEEGTKVLKASGTRDQQTIWQGQYFMESEYLLFNVPGSSVRQKQVLKTWRQHWRPGVLQDGVVSLYLAIARVAKKRMYLLLRIARRAAMMILPATFFPTRSGFQSACLSGDAIRELDLRFQHFAVADAGSTDAS